MQELSGAKHWFHEKRFGMFVHWGIYAVGGIHEQHQMRLHVPAAEYQKYAAQFNPVKFDPAQWLDLAQERFILVPMRTSPSFRNYVCGFCETKGGFAPMTSDEISSSYAALRLVEAGMGITVVSATYAGLFGDRLCYRQFSDFQPMLPVYAVYADSNSSPPLKNFLNILKTNAARSPEKIN